MVGSQKAKGSPGSCPEMSKGYPDVRKRIGPGYILTHFITIEAF